MASLPPTTPEPGDLILYTVSGRSALSSRLVAAGELLWGAGRGSKQYSHVAVQSWAPGWQFEAKWPHTGYFRIDSKRPYEVWRIEGTTEQQRKIILRWCLEHSGQWYDIIELLTFGLVQHRNAAVCSQFAGRAYAAAGIHIGLEGKGLLSPDAIPDDKRARLVCYKGGRP